MHLEPCTWQQVVKALERCGVTKIKEDDYHVFMARFPLVKTISKRGLVPSAIQRDLLSSFGILHVEYISFIPEEAPLN